MINNNLYRKKLKKIYLLLVKSIFLSSFLINLTSISKASEHKAICSFYSEYKPCKVSINNETITANLPTDFLHVDKSNFLDLKIYEDLSKSSNVILGTTTTLLLGPIGLLGFLATKKSGTIDFEISFVNDRQKEKKAFIRFINMNAAKSFTSEISMYINNLSLNK